MTIAADSLDVTLTGPCRKVEVKGRYTNLTADSIEVLDAPAEYATVEVRSVATLLADGAQGHLRAGNVQDLRVTGDHEGVTVTSGTVPHIQIGGTYQTLDLPQAGTVQVGGGDATIRVTGTITSLTITGDHNKITWGSGQPTVDNSGTDNTLRRGAP